MTKAHRLLTDAGKWYGVPQCQVSCRLVIRADGSLRFQLCVWQIVLTGRSGTKSSQLCGPSIREAADYRAVFRYSARPRVCVEIQNLPESGSGNQRPYLTLTPRVSTQQTGFDQPRQWQRPIVLAACFAAADHCSHSLACFLRRLFSLLRLGHREAAGSGASRSHPGQRPST
jgi:hypothetical protein